MSAPEEGDAHEEISVRGLVRKVIEEAMGLERSLDSKEPSGKDALDSAIRMRILTGELFHRIVSDRKEGKQQDA